MSVTPGLVPRCALRISASSSSNSRSRRAAALPVSTSRRRLASRSLARALPSSPRAASTRLIASRLRLDPCELGGPEPLLPPGQIGGQPLGDHAGVPWPVLGLAGQAFTGQPGKLCVGPTGVEPAEGVGQVPSCGLAVNLTHGPTGECRPAGQDLAEDRAQRENVGPLVEPIEIAARLLRWHV